MTDEYEYTYDESVQAWRRVKIKTDANPSSDEYLTTDQAAELAGVTRTRVLQMLNNGRLTGEKRGRDWFVLKSSVLLWTLTKKNGRPRKS